jgi:NTE family protein
MDDDLLSLLRTSKMFSSINEEGLVKLLPKFEKVELNHGEFLFQQGDPANYICLLKSGRLATSFTTLDGHIKTIAHVEPGEPVGETGVMTHEPRSLSAKAVKDSVLYKLSDRDFFELCNQYPGVMFASINPIIMRSRSLIEVLSSERKIKHVVILAANRETPLTDFSQRLLESATDYSSVITVTDDHPDFQDRSADSTILQEKIQALEKSKAKSSHKLVYVLTSYDSPLAKLALKKADSLYLVAFSHAKIIIDPLILEKIASRRQHHKSDPNLILLHTNKTLTPHRTIEWLAQAQFDFHHHVRVDMTKDYQRLLRFIRGKAVGIVLGGGGTRGWAHLGVLKAVREKKIPIDMIGGTSVGAIIGACFAMHESVEDAYERFYKIVQESNHSVSWRSLTWPAISIFNAKSFTKSQMEVFGDTQIEDLWLPFFCISSNLASNTEGIHRSGTLWEKTRASAALPGILPPSLINGELHYDGGLLNNLPVGVMRDILGTKARVIASEINSFSTDKHKYTFPPILTFWKTLLAQLGFGFEAYKFPRFVDTFLRSLFIGSLANAQKNALSANVFVSLNLNKYRLLHTNFKQIDQIIQIGYEEAIKQIDAFREKH